MPEKYTKVDGKTANKEFVRQFKLVRKATEMLNLTEEWENIQFVHEYLFTVTKDGGKELEFICQWKNLANYFENHGFYDAEGNAIGLAAAKAGMGVIWSDMPGISFFNYKNEIIRIEKGQSKIEEMSKYFEEHDRIIDQEEMLLNKILGGINRKIQQFLRKIPLLLPPGSPASLLCILPQTCYFIL